MATASISVNFYFHGDAITIPVGQETIVRTDDGSEVRGKLQGGSGAGKSATIRIRPDDSVVGVGISVSRIVGVTGADGRLHQDRKAAKV